MKKIRKYFKRKENQENWKDSALVTAIVLFFLFAPLEVIVVTYLISIAASIVFIVKALMAQKKARKVKFTEYEIIS